ncbi:hypothetical protein RCL1_004403 [Eukaryota sp. TZLM3-RCL]
MQDVIKCFSNGKFSKGQRLLLKSSFENVTQTQFFDLVSVFVSVLNGVIPVSEEKQLVDFCPRTIISYIQRLFLLLQSSNSFSHEFISSNSWRALVTIQLAKKDFNSVDFLRSFIQVKPSLLGFIFSQKPPTILPPSSYSPPNLSFLDFSSCSDLLSFIPTTCPSVYLVYSDLNNSQLHGKEKILRTRNKGSSSPKSIKSKEKQSKNESKLPKDVKVSFKNISKLVNKSNEEKEMIEFILIQNLIANFSVFHGLTVYSCGLKTLKDLYQFSVEKQRPISFDSLHWMIQVSNHFCRHVSSFVDDLIAFDYGLALLLSDLALLKVFSLQDDQNYSCLADLLSVPARIFEKFESNFPDSLIVSILIGSKRMSIGSRIGAISTLSLIGSRNKDHRLTFLPHFPFLTGLDWVTVCRLLSLFLNLNFSTIDCCGQSITTLIVQSTPIKLIPVLISLIVIYDPFEICKKILNNFPDENSKHCPIFFDFFSEFMTLYSPYASRSEQMELYSYLSTITSRNQSFFQSKMSLSVCKYFVIAQIDHVISQAFWNSTVLNNLFNVLHVLSLNVIESKNVEILDSIIACLLNLVYFKPANWAFPSTLSSIIDIIMSLVLKSRGDFELSLIKSRQSLAFVSFLTGVPVAKNFVYAEDYKIQLKNDGLDLSSFLFSLILRHVALSQSLSVDEVDVDCMSSLIRHSCLFDLLKSIKPLSSTVEITQRFDQIQSILVDNESTLPRGTIVNSSEVEVFHSCINMSLAELEDDSKFAVNYSVRALSMYTSTALWIRFLGVLSKFLTNILNTSGEQLIKAAKAQSFDCSRFVNFELPLSDPFKPSDIINHIAKVMGFLNFSTVTRCQYDILIDTFQSFFSFLTLTSRRAYGLPWTLQPSPFPLSPYFLTSIVPFFAFHTEKHISILLSSFIAPLNNLIQTILDDKNLEFEDKKGYLLPLNFILLVTLSNFYHSAPTSTEILAKLQYVYPKSIDPDLYPVMELLNVRILVLQQSINLDRLRQLIVVFDSCDDSISYIFSMIVLRSAISLGSRELISHSISRLCTVSNHLKHAPSIKINYNSAIFTESYYIPFTSTHSFFIDFNVENLLMYGFMAISEYRGLAALVHTSGFSFIKSTSSDFLNSRLVSFLNAFNFNVSNQDLLDHLYLAYYCQQLKRSQSADLGLLNLVNFYLDRTSKPRVGSVVNAVGVALRLLKDSVADK